MKIKVKYYEDNISNNTIENTNYIALYVLGIKVKKIKIKRMVHTNTSISNNNNNMNVVNTIFMVIKQIAKSLEKEEIVRIVSKLAKSIRVNSLDMKLGINTNDYILNSYIICIINSILPLLIAKYPHNFNLKNISYETYISKKTLDLKIEGIFYISIVKNITSIVKIIYVILKGGIKNGNKTSNRISNGNINDFNRKYGRC